MRRRSIVASALAAASLTCAAPALAQQGPYAPWDGSNPFKCTIQDVGSGTDFPDPDADPFCVEFDKTSQNLTEFGILDFLANEPARVAAASPKCFYYQSDHWTGSVVQGEPPELWHWDGQYFFDKAMGVGGVNVQNFRVGGQPASPSDYGEVPTAFAPYMDQGGGGAYTNQGIPTDPNCVARVDTPQEREQVYAGGQPPPLPPRQYRRGPCARQNTVRGSREDDELIGGPFGDRLFGRRGDDLLVGARGGDCLRGQRGRDRLRGGRGRDKLRGGPKADRLRGGRGRDRLRGGKGDDVLLAADRRRDLVRCGPGADRASIDAIDRARGCERTAIAG